MKIELIKYLILLVIVIPLTKLVTLGLFLPRYFTDSLLLTYSTYPLNISSAIYSLSPLYISLLTALIVYFIARLIKLKKPREFSVVVWFFLLLFLLLPSFSRFLEPRFLKATFSCGVYNDHAGLDPPDKDTTQKIEKAINCFYNKAKKCEYAALLGKLSDWEGGHGTKYLEVREDCTILYVSDYYGDLTADKPTTSEVCKTIDLIEAYRHSNLIPRECTEL